METYTVAIENAQATQVSAESPEEAVRCVVSQADKRGEISDQVVVTVSNYGRYCAQRHVIDYEYERGNVDAPIDVIEFSVKRIDD